ncbi:hypothetical protein [Plantactinospora sp. KLBMP9567]|uniref:hypothetical protein n=1 Tax=Plantactinospora sp. KLBMP9567 TaxID=3085900 RepID=UPI002981697A|nr:hypothetical protein [Plantactinospora sp. KLBMP9567]MDW5327550.1 hypothetical protein [Plantactinospora sp. KLBMP9567]
MTDPHRSHAAQAAAIRGAIRGAFAAMAMSGVRQVTTGLGLVRRTPPEEVLRQTEPSLFRRIPVDRRQALIELVHWAYGAGGGMLFGLLPRSVRRQGWAGPAYGFAFWAVFEAGLAPLLGIDERRHGGRERWALLADHLLYGAVVAASPWPHAD